MSSKLALLGGTPVRSRPFPSWPIFGKPEEKRLLRTLRSGKWGRLEGLEVARFEKRFATMHGCTHGIAVVNGTVSLRLGLLAAGIRAGDEVIVPPYTFFSTASAVIEANAVPVFADIDPDSFNLDPAAVKAAITSRTRAILPVHFAGQPAEMDAIMAIARKHKLIVIEDAAHAHGASYKKRPAGSLGHMGSFSFQSSKNLTAGEGGILVTNDDAIAAASRSLQNCGRVPGGLWYEHHRISGNYRLGEFQGAVLNAQVDRLNSQTKTRDRNGQYLAALLAGIPGLHPQKRSPNCTRHSYHLFMLRLDPRQFGVPRAAVLKALAAEGIPCSAGYGFSLHHQPMFRNKAFGPYLPEQSAKLDYSKMHCPVSDLICREQGLWLGQSLLLGSRSDMEQVARALGKIFENREALVRWARDEKIAGQIKVNAATAFLNKRLVPALTAFSDNTYLSAIRSGMVAVVPLTIIGGIFMIVAYLPVEGWTAWVAPHLNMLQVPVTATFGLLAVFVCFAIGYDLGKRLQQEAIISASMATVVFLLLQIQSKDQSLSMDGLGSKGLFMAIVIALICVRVQKFFTDRNLVIRLPAQVPPAVYDSFLSLAPLLFLILLFWVIRFVLGIDIQTLIQSAFKPFVFALNTLPGILVYAFLVTLLWSVGINGDNTLDALVAPVFLQYLAANVEATAAGLPLPYITANGFFTTFVNVGGTGATIALALVLWNSKEPGLRKISRISMPTQIFQINEPIFFGIPIVLNPIFMIPYILNALILTAGTYLLMHWNLIHKPFVNVPWTTPPIIGHYLVSGGDWRAALWGACSIAIAMLVYYPFAKAAERQRLKAEATRAPDENFAP